MRLAIIYIRKGLKIRLKGDLIRYNLIEKVLILTNSGFYLTGLKLGAFHWKVICCDTITMPS